MMHRANDVNASPKMLTALTSPDVHNDGSVDRI